MAPGGLLGAPGASWGLLGPPGGLLRPPGASLGPPWALLGPPWGLRKLPGASLGFPDFKILQKLSEKMPKTQGFSHQIEELQIQIFTKKLD